MLLALSEPGSHSCCRLYYSLNNIHAVGFIKAWLTFMLSALLEPGFHSCSQFYYSLAHIPALGLSRAWLEINTPDFIKALML